MMIIPNHMLKSYTTCVYYLPKLFIMMLEDLCRNIRWNKPSIFCNFVDPMDIPCNNHLVHISLECWYEYIMKKGLVKFISND